MSKSSYKTMAEAISFGILKKAKFPKMTHRRLTIDEIKDTLFEEFKKAKKVSDEEIQEPEKGWGDAELAKYVDWIKTLDLGEAFGSKKKKGK